MTANWIYLAIGSGLAAGLNRLFAKLVTTTLTSSLASIIAGVFSLPKDSQAIEYLVRGLFFGLNLLFNAIMWGLFTAALAKGSSATKVSVMNTSSNFMTTAILGSVVFSESLPGTWWLGAGLLVAGNVVIVMRDEGTVEASHDGMKPLKRKNSRLYRNSSLDGTVRARVRTKIPRHPDKYFAYSPLLI